jgi:DNA-binding transcriptional regulator YdaS (Cro superfamily)
MTQSVTPSQALVRAVAIAGGQSATARICNKSQSAVWKWLQSERSLPAEHVLAMEAATGVHRHLLRPDIYPISLGTGADAPGADSAPVMPTEPASVVCDQPAKAQRAKVAA